VGGLSVSFNGPRSKRLAKKKKAPAGVLTFDFWCPVSLFSRQKDEITCVVAGVADQMDTHISWLALHTSTEDKETVTTLLTQQSRHSM
jgi:mannitol/fructose-specific phosphotransferase system IIA component